LRVPANVNASSDKITAHLQSALRRQGRIELAAVEAAVLLDEAGLLRDSPSRPGKPLRDLLRKGLVGGAEQRPPQPNGRWFITRVRAEAAMTPTEESEIKNANAGGPGSDPGGEMSVAQVVRQLQAAPVAIPPAIQTRTSSIPDRPGFYAWWSTRGAIPSLDSSPNPCATQFEILYVGISPARSSSHQGIRSRVIGQHINGNTSSSTFRFALASLLIDELGLAPERRSSKVVLTKADNERLRHWQYEHLALTWCERIRPWEIEEHVIKAMAPPLNSSGNTTHPFYPTIQSRRAAFRNAAALFSRHRNSAETK
jgi:hypothetical protein